MKTKVFLLVVMSLIFSTAAQARLAGKNVVLVHGFQPEDLANPPNVSTQRADADRYFNEFWLSRSEARIFFSSADRVTGGIKDSVRNQFRTLERNRTCANGCIFVTHSTGDLVLRDALSRLGQWNIDRNNFRVLTVLDFAGAGGGTELADVANAIANGSGFINGIQRAAIRAFLGVDPEPNRLGVLNDLRPSVARNIATGNSGVPRLRFVGAGDQFLRITKPFIRGFDDSVVPFHSACGARGAGDYESCNRSIRSNGDLRSARAPSSFYPNHFPILMGDSTDHSEAISNSRSGGGYATINNNRTFGGIRVDFNDEVSRGGFLGFGSRQRLVRDGDRRSMSDNVFRTLN